jgi:hypothetical protein
MSGFLDMIFSIVVMGVVVFIALIPSSHDNLYHKRLERYRRRNASVKNKDASKFFKDNK